MLLRNFPPNVAVNKVLPQEMRVRSPLPLSAGFPVTPWETQALPHFIGEETQDHRARQWLSKITHLVRFDLSGSLPEGDDFQRNVEV